MSENQKLMLRYFIRDEFTGKLSETCNMVSRKCRGGSSDLYKLLISSKSLPQYMNNPKDNLEIVSGLGHTFIRYRDTEYNRYLYIDPTIAQFYPKFEGIFVGDEKDLQNIVDEQAITNKNRRYKLDIKDYIGGPDRPPLKIENILMKGGKRKTHKTMKRTRRLR
jgi:hypothetical protein